MTNSALDAERRSHDLQDLGDGAHLDVLVVGGGVTGCGVALDAASRGLSVALVERWDLAWGTSRFSSKLVHGGLRYLATGQVGVAHESALERDILARRTAPHLIHPYAQVMPFGPDMGRAMSGLLQVGQMGGDMLRAAARTPAAYLPRARRIDAGRTLDLAPCLDADGLRGGMEAWDCRLVDDARLVIALARTAAAFGARILTRVRVEEPTGTGARLVDTLTGESMTVHARCVINATGVWSAELDPAIRLRPSRGTHLVLPAERLGNLQVGVMTPVPGSISRYVFTVPADLGRVHLGLTDVETRGDIPDVARPEEEEIAFLLEVINPLLARPLDRAEVAGTFAGLRPLIDNAAGQSADVSRRHAIIRSAEGMLTIVGGKLTTYRRMAQDVVDRAVTEASLPAGPCRTHFLPLVGAGSPARLAALRAPGSIVARHGMESDRIVASARPEWLVPLSRRLDVGAGVDLTEAEMRFAVTHEGALLAEDLLDRRSRVGVVPADRQAVEPLARELAPMEAPALR